MDHIELPIKSNAGNISKDVEIEVKTNNDNFGLLTEQTRGCDNERLEKIKCEFNDLKPFDFQCKTKTSKTIKNGGLRDEKRILDEDNFTQNHKINDFKVPQALSKLGNCSKTLITDKSLYKNQVVNPYKTIIANPVQISTLDEQDRFIKSQSLEFYHEQRSATSIYRIPDYRFPTKVQKKCCTDDSEFAEMLECVPKTLKAIDYCSCLGTESLKKCPTKTSSATLQHNTAIKPQSIESRPIYPNVPYSPYSSPFGSPHCSRRRPFRECRRISIEKSGSFLQLNQYKLMEQIGQGSYGLVKLAYSEEDSTHYAMKILSKKRLVRQAGLMRRGPRKTTSPLDRVYREIAVLKKLDHPNVVKLVEVLDDPQEDSLYMVFELVQQGEVLRIPTDKPLSEEKAWSIFREALLGLEYLHHQKIIHADIKPGNLLLTESGHVKIADFGVCNEFLGEDAKISNGSSAGTPAFRAPETLILGQNEYCGKAADVWALGATLYSLIFGNVPFLADSVPVLYEKIKQDCVSFPENHFITENLKSCIVQMLEKDVKHRITVPLLKVNKWVTSGGEFPLPTEEENCNLVQVDDKDINSVVRSIPKLKTLILIKTMLKKHSFANPFVKESFGKISEPSCSRIDKFVCAGRSNSAPGSYHISTDRQSSTDTLLPSVKEQ
ncbi:calcium/calmodulin-dependent protein kinase kinase 1 isoform X1 [Drosophila biarmipes]|nr:calcium/calmodulin-dependent protein kinase kinase 1 isoform X1 [Drosophila biarmipes]XP_050742162.1 calcium/calmodulin-dependent protein kinase kinase 1 isoform X1 [Drosophila biarmipes]XP_050742163.1 calcium/calmodulin-dependent protein kinase kinase 1 isoform X1 [Drosophila biarmipes]XP_050742164.1 calcium/calmodulin-dependent protein kinase kinase 1 isoform X1 [Drosophila biarmipes]XP_050742165.1 calcium/calmodulin-dependent protein kinase kinase 1 isoform X1 [Drosophila biarmipes]XP_05